MTGLGEMPRPGSEPALSDRWLAERADLLADGPTQRYRAHGRLEPVPRDGGWWEVGHVLIMVIAILGMRVAGGPSSTPPERVALGLYRRDAEPGDVPEAIVDLPLGLGVLERVAAQGGEVDVRGVVGPGHGLVVVLDDGEAIGCVGPTRPPPPVFARRTWGWGER